MGRSPRSSEDQITYPLITNLQGLPKVKVRSWLFDVRDEFHLCDFQRRGGYLLGTSKGIRKIKFCQQFVTGWSEVRPRVRMGVGHVLWYTLDAPEMDLGEQRAIQDWYVKFALQNVSGVSEVASFGGFEKQYQVTIDRTNSPITAYQYLRSFNPLEIITMVRRSQVRAK